MDGVGTPCTGELLPDSQPLFGASVTSLEWKPQFQIVHCRGSFESLLDARQKPEDIESVLLFHRAWASLVWEYTCCKLTKPGDKLVALSGIAQRIRQATEFHYRAGLWQETLMLDLCWFISRRPQPRPSQYRAPS
jgi:hypothetical protein